MLNVCFVAICWSDFHTNQMQTKSGRPYGVTSASDPPPPPAWHENVDGWGARPSMLTKRTCCCRSGRFQVVARRQQNLFVFDRLFQAAKEQKRRDGRYTHVQFNLFGPCVTDNRITFPDIRTLGVEKSRAVTAANCVDYFR